MTMIDFISDHTQYIMSQMNKGIMDAEAALRKNGGHIENKSCTVNIRMQDEWNSVEFSLTFRPGHLKEAEQ